MTKLLEQAIESLKKLPESDQDEAAEFLFDLMAHGTPIALDDETRASVREGLAQARRGEFAPDEEVEAFFARHRG
jgi:predicted transcriptional regulator